MKLEVKWTKYGLRYKKEKPKLLIINKFRFYLAESEGFEPPEPRGSTVFKTAAIDHSANSPRQKYINFQK